MIDHVREWRVISPRDLRENAVEIIYQCIGHASHRIDWETAYIQRRVFRYSPSLFRDFPKEHVNNLINKYGFKSIEETRDARVDEGAVQMLNLDHLIWFLADYFQLNEMVAHAMLTVEGRLAGHLRVFSKSHYFLER